MNVDMNLLSQIWTNKYQSNDERDIEELILEMECEEDAKLQSLRAKSVLLWK